MALMVGYGSYPINNYYLRVGEMLTLHNKNGGIYMFKKLRKYVKNVDCGLIEQKVNVIVESNEDLKLSPDNNYYEQYGKLMEIKDYIETHVHGITVKVSGGEKVLSDDLGYDRRPIVVRTVKNDDPSFYNEVSIKGVLMDERD